MRSWFGARRTQTAGGHRAGPDVERERADAQLTGRDVADAYERGRRDEARRHRGSPLLSLLVLIIIVGAALLIYLAAREGSFAGGGAVVDNNISQAANTVQAPFKRAAGKAGDTLENAGQTLKQDSGQAPANP